MYPCIIVVPKSRIEALSFIASFALASVEVLTVSVPRLPSLLLMTLLNSQLPRHLGMVVGLVLGCRALIFLVFQP